MGRIFRVALAVTLAATIGRQYYGISFRKGGRVVDCTGLENRPGVTPQRGFESHPFRWSILPVSTDE